MQTQIALSFIGADRPGLVETLSRIISGHDGNWLESRFLRLAGTFAGVALISAPNERLGDLLAALDGLQQQGLRVLTETSSDDSCADGDDMRLTVIGHDRPGIVHEFAQALAKRQISFLELNSDITSAPMTGGPLFVASATIRLPAHLDLDELHDELEAIAEELTVEYTLEADGG